MYGWPKALSRDSKNEKTMKRHGNLWEQVISIENLRLADEKARKGKRNTYGVRLHDRNRETNLWRLHDMLITKTYKTSDYNVFIIYEPKEREIYRLPYYPDRIVHHAIMNILEPIWLKTFTYNTYSCVKDRGIHGCMKQVENIIKKYKDSPRLYCLKIDIRKYYPTIDHEIMKQVVRRTIKDKDLLWLIDEIIDSTQGMPIGNYLSQYLANLYLCYVMHWVNEELPKILGYKVYATEYADDICFFCDRKDILRICMSLLRTQIEEGLNLKIKDNWQIFPIARNRQDKSGRGLDYVGYVFYRDLTLMRKNLKKNFCRAMRKLSKNKKMTDKEKMQYIASWLGWAKHCDSKHLLITIFKNKDYESTLRQQALRTGGNGRRKFPLQNEHQRRDSKQRHAGG